MLVFGFNVPEYSVKDKALSIRRGQVGFFYVCFVGTAKPFLHPNPLVGQCSIEAVLEFFSRINDDPSARASGHALYVTYVTLHGKEIGVGPLTRILTASAAVAGSWPHRAGLLLSAGRCE